MVHFKGGVALIASLGFIATTGSALAGGRNGSGGGMRAGWYNGGSHASYGASQGRTYGGQGYSRAGYGQSSYGYSRPTYGRSNYGYTRQTYGQTGVGYDRGGYGSYGYGRSSDIQGGYGRGYGRGFGYGVAGYGIGYGVGSYGTSNYGGYGYDQAGYDQAGYGYPTSSLPGQDYVAPAFGYGVQAAGFGLFGTPACGCH